MTDPNEAKTFGVTITPLEAGMAKTGWRVRRVYALSGAENAGKHNLYVEAYDQAGAKLRGVKAEFVYRWGNIPPNVVTLDKPLNEYGANLPMYLSQVYGVRMTGAPSDFVDGVSTKHADGEPGNTMGHWSFVAELEQVTLGETPEPPVPPTPPQPPTPPAPGKATVILSAANVASLRTYPRPPKDNGIGLHFCIDLTDANIARNVEHLQSIRATWTLIYAQDEVQAERAALACFQAGIMPVVRVGKLITDFNNSGAYVAALRRALAKSDFAHDPAKPPFYVQCFNEPEDSREWKDGVRPANWPQYFGQKWVAEAVQVVAAGGYPGLQVLDRRAFDAVVDAVNAAGAQHIWERAWFCHHDYGVNHPPSYPYDAINQASKPGQTIADDYQCVLKPLAHALWMQERLGFVLPLIGGEGGWWVGNEEDRRYAKLTWQGMADWTKETFEWFAKGVLSNGEALPDYLFSVTPWIAESATFFSQAWWGNGLSPTGTAAETIAAVRAIPPFVRRFSWDSVVTPPAPPEPPTPPQPPEPLPPSGALTMRLHPPLNRPLVVTQAFGANPQVYGKWGLPGHEGIDYRAATGTPVMAVDDGTVALVGTTGNYGLNYRIVHPWGESVYAHLSKQLVSMGQRVVKGQVIGLSGSTGNSDGPHLHFGLRVAPFFRDSKRDKWQGFCNAAPYFQPERFLLGPHIHNGNGSMIPLLRQWQPAAVTLLDPAPDFVAELAAASPSTNIVGRIYRPDSEVSDRIKANPGAAAQWMHELVTTHPASAGGHVTYWQIANEVCQGPDWDSYVKLDQCMWHWMDLARGAYHCGLYAFGVGNPNAPVNDPNWWNKITPTLQRAKAEGHVLLIHEYGTGDGLDGPAAKGGADWLAQRYVRQVRPWLQVRDVQIIVSEFGYDGLLIGDKAAGWRTSGKTAATYAGELIAMNDNYARYRDQIVGVTVYTKGALDEWSSYNIDGEVEQMLAARAEQVRTGDVVITPPVVVGDPSATGWTAAAKQLRLQLNPGAALQKVMVKDGFAPVTSEFTFAQDGVSYIGQVAERTDRADKARLYYCPVGQWGDVRQGVEP